MSTYSSRSRAPLISAAGTRSIACAVVARSRACDAIIRWNSDPSATTVQSAAATRQRRAILILRAAPNKLRPHLHTPTR